MSSSTDARRLGVDVHLPDDPDGDLVVTATGDVSLVAGRSNLAGALRRRMATSPGTMVHRPEYGAGLEDQVESPGTPGERARLAATIRRQVLRDPRLAEARARVRAGDPDLGEPAATTIVQLSYRIRDDEQDEITAVLTE